MKKIFFIVIILLLAVPFFAQADISGGFAMMNRPAPQPRLISPTTEEVDLRGKNTLEFKWSPHEGCRDREYYDFRLYRGYDMYEDTLILKKRVPDGAYQISLDAGMFENGQVYTWSLRQVCGAMGKSMRSFSSFRVIKG